ncbi:hypothetical protein C8039_18580 [Halogeometricum sp. wsp3]|nr:hypothetical protein C8039_18580 [Halogeometricum sp. wsp3]
MTPLAVVLHAIGAAWGVLSPIEEFDVTTKIPRPSKKTRPAWTSRSRTGPNQTGINGLTEMVLVQRLAVGYNLQ